MVKPLAFKGEKKAKKRKASFSRADEQPSIENKPKDVPSNVQEDDSWVTADIPSDINGPIVIVLRSTPLTCIACDAGGKVFASELENTVEGDPATAEPHDVRQVWIASRIAGTDNIGFKGHHQNIGKFAARTEAMSPEESFVCIPSPDTPGTFNIQTAREKFISVTEDSKEIRGNADCISFNTTVHLRMQARFKPKLKASKELKAKEKISRKELEEIVGRKLDDDEVRRLKKARVRGDYHEAVLDVRVKGKHDKYS
ncbi:MAG: hypothetical protein LQ352_001343 [Teloschistes flavicans]|nr:MAG: hypothetical protein LQ352_001343 [Teloschistes flavicans]